MRAGVLIIGSLLWDNQPGAAGSKGARRRAEVRKRWQQTHLLFDDAVHGRAPIHYGRLSAKRNNTYTMTFVPGRPSGKAVVVPCANPVHDGKALIAEAEALWQAEDLGADSGSISARWGGCVGVLFRDESASSNLLEAWSEHFRAKKVISISPVDSNGKLNIRWPTTVQGKQVDVDVILATTNKGEQSSAKLVADAWLCNGCEDYFFQNVRCGIRTPDDGTIWKRIEEHRPGWLSNTKYEEAIAILRQEAASRGRSA